jgi:hypothetical protein
MKSPALSLLALLSLVAGVIAVGGDPSLAAAGARVQQDRPFSLAVLRRDGLVIPFAVFDGRWKTPWPQAMRAMELPIALTDVPKRWWGVDEPFERMAIWRDGQRAGEVTITGLTTSRVMCEPRIVLRSDYKASAPVPPPFERPYPKDGLLVGGGVPVQRIESVARGAPDWNRALVAITPDFNKAESTAAGRYTDWRHPFDADDRRLVPITIESLYRAPGETPEWTSYFVEAVRQYPPGRQDKDNCGPLTYVFGWVMLGPKDKWWVHLVARVTYCDRYGVRYMLPLGTVKARNRVYWVFQFAGAEGEWYEVTRPLPGRLESHASYNAGTCSY